MLLSIYPTIECSHLHTCHKNLASNIENPFLTCAKHMPRYRLFFFIYIYIYYAAFVLYPPNLFFPPYSKFEKRHNQISDFIITDPHFIKLDSSYVSPPQSIFLTNLHCYSPFQTPQFFISPISKRHSSHF